MSRDDSKGLAEKLEVKERNILRESWARSKKIVSPEDGTTTSYTYAGKNNVHDSEKDDCLLWPPDTNEPARFTNRIFTYSISKKTKGAWFTDLERNFQEVGITHGDIQERDPLKEKRVSYKIKAETKNRQNY